MASKDGGPAFPRPHFRLSNGTLEGGEGGMTLRDYFAAKAMQGLLQYTYTHADRASVAYKAADAMLKAREENV